MLYTVDARTDKVAAAKADPTGSITMESVAGPVTSTATESSAKSTQKVTLNANKTTVAAKGDATAKITYEPLNILTNAKNKPEYAFAAAAIHDPITYELDSPGASGSVDVTIPFSSDPLFLQVTDPQGSASAFFELDVNDVALLVFHFGLDFTTASAAQR